MTRAVAVRDGLVRRARPVAAVLDEGDTTTADTTADDGTAAARHLAAARDHDLGTRWAIDALGGRTVAGSVETHGRFDRTGAGAARITELPTCPQRPVVTVQPPHPHAARRTGAGST